MKNNDVESIGNSDSFYRYLQSADNEEELDSSDYLPDDDDDPEIYSSQIDIELKVTEIKSNLNFDESKKNIPELTDSEKRLNIIAQLNELYDKQKKLKLKNSLLHKKCRDYFIKTKVTKCFEKSIIASHIHTNLR